MKLIAQEVRMYNKNGDDFQRVYIFLKKFLIKISILFLVN